MRELSSERRQFGYRRLHILLVREGWEVNWKKLYRIYREERLHLVHFLTAYNFARRLKTLNGLTLHEYICKVLTPEPDRFTSDPIQHMPGRNA